MRTALTTLPWVESDTITTNAKTRQVKFTVKAKASYNFDQVKSALGSRYADGLKQLTGPTDQ